MTMWPPTTKRLPEVLCEASTTPARIQSSGFPMFVVSSLALLMSLEICVRSDLVALPYRVDRYLAAYIKLGLTVVARTWIFYARLLNVDCNSALRTSCFAL